MSKSAKKHSKLKIVIICIIIALVAAAATATVLTLVHPKSQKNLSKKTSEEITDLDSERKNIASSVISSLTAYQMNNRGNIPNSKEQWQSFWDSYIKDPKDSEGATYTLAGTCEHSEKKSACIMPLSLDWKTDQHKVYIATNAVCGGSAEGDIQYTSTPNKVAVYLMLSNNAAFCQNN